jgi:acetylornithine deacetylase/succinyl-diaminopimelate desuccinylase-like protein
VGSLPVRVKFLIEGEEEVGSPHLVPFITKYKNELACDCVAISDTAKFDDKTPAITYGTRGLVYKQIDFSGPKMNLHSGSFGGTLTNPCNALATVLSGMKDADNRVTIPGFYDEVLELTPEEQAEVGRLPFDEDAYRKSMGCPVLDGEAGYSTLLRRWVRPTLDVNGLHGGFVGEGASTIVPAKCFAKVSMRLVPNQDPTAISAAFDEAVTAMAPPGVRVEISSSACASPYVSPIDSPAMKAAVTATEAGFQVRPVFTREGGTLPILAEFKKVLGADSIMMGFCLPDSNAHGPNEFMVIDDFYAGIRTAAHFLAEMGKVAR